MGSSTPLPIKVLYHLHPDLDTLDFTGPYELLSHALYASTQSSPDGPTAIFENTITAAEVQTTTHQNLTLTRHIPLNEAYAKLADYDILIIPGGGTVPVLEKNAEPISLVAAFAALPRRADGAVRTILSVCTGSIFLAQAGVLAGLTATTHYLYYDRLKEYSARHGKTEVLDVRFVVNKVDEEKGLRIITSGGVSCGLDSTLWLIGDVAGSESRDRTAKMIQYAWREGVVL